MIVSIGWGGVAHDLRRYTSKAIRWWKRGISTGSGGASTWCTVMETWAVLERVGVSARWKGFAGRGKKEGKRRERKRDARRGGRREKECKRRGRADKVCESNIAGVANRRGRR